MILSHRNSKLDELLGLYVEVHFIKALKQEPMRGFLGWEPIHKCYTLSNNCIGISDKYAFRQSYVTSVKRA